MSNAFYFILKAISVLKILKFLSWLVGHGEKTASVSSADIWRHNLGNTYA